MADDGFDMRDLFVLARSLEADAKLLPREVQLAVTETLGDIAQTAKDNTPIDTRFNLNSITFDVHYTPTGAYGDVGPESEYGGYLELGTSRMAPQPYLFPAADAHMAQFEARLASLL